MVSVRSLLLSIAPLAVLISATASANADALFNFENIPQGTDVSPFTDTVNGLTASFAGAVEVCNVDGTGLNFVTLSGKVLTQGAGAAPGCNSPAVGPMYIGFSSDLSSISFNFATGSSPSSTLILRAFENSTLVGTSVFTSSVPPGNFPNGEGSALFSGASFNNFVLTTNSILAVDNINAITATSGVPEPASVTMLAAGGAILVMLARHTRKRQTN